MQHPSLTPTAWRIAEEARVPAAEPSLSWVPALLCDLVAFGPLLLMLFL
jgi:hypothetical protein